MVNKVKSVSAPTGGSAPAACCAPAITQKTSPAPVKRRQALASAAGPAPFTVQYKFIATAAIGMIVSTVPTSDTLTSHAGSGAPPGMPPQLPASASIQNAKAA